MTNPLTSHISIAICKDASDATRQGYFYRPPIYKPIQVEKIVIVKSGTEAGNPTVDFVLEDESGQKYVFMITGRLLKSLPLKVNDE